MATKKRAPELIRGTASHRRTEGDYMGVLLDAVSLEDWRGVVTGALQAAQGGDPQARNWLAQYLIGRPEGKAPTPLTVVVNQLSGNDLVINRLADKLTAPTFDFGDTGNRAQITQQLHTELTEKINHAQLLVNPIPARAGAGFEHD